MLKQIESEILRKLTFSEEILQELSDTLKNALKSENEYHLTEIAQFKKSHLMDLLLDESITKEEYDAKKNELEETLYNIKVKLDTHTNTDSNFINTLESLILLASQALELFRSSKVDEKRAILNILLSNSTLKDGKVQISLQKPFDMLVNLKDCSRWLGRTDSNRDKENQNLLSYR